MIYEDYKARVIAAQNLWKNERSGIHLTQHLAQLSTILAGSLSQPSQQNDDSYELEQTLMPGLTERPIPPLTGWTR
ncbi:hypothetical protein AB0H58_16360 [Nocardia neocaledoniensis]|uniref:hypothetical protein n=1 Tax=Nocardia neocaledoniensis TaxID=236511 RepID=UPI00340065AC